MRIAVIGGGIAGSLLAWRLRQASQRVLVDVFTGDLPPDSDATGASGGLIRGFEVAAESGRQAAESLAEIRGSAMLREWTAYHEVGSVYLLPRGADPTEPLRTVDELIPGSASVFPEEKLSAEFGFRELPAGTTGVVERYAGYFSPARLRAAVLAHLAAEGTTIHPIRVAEVTPAPRVRLADGTTLGYDVVVVAAGAWTPNFFADNAHMRTKQIQCGVYAVRLPGLGAFVDETSGLYGRPFGEASFLFGLASQRWDVDPAAVVPDPVLAEAATACARQRFGVTIEPRPPARIVASADGYHTPEGLELRPHRSSSAVFTFAGGSGGAAKTVLAASRMAAARLLELDNRRPGGLT